MAAPTVSDTTEVALRYFQAAADRDADGMAAMWAPGATDRLMGDQDLVAPEGVRTFFRELFAAFPDWQFEVLSTTTEGERCAVQWRGRATFAGPGSFAGFEPTGSRVELEGCDVVEVRGGLLQHNEAYTNQLSLVRQLGVLPPAQSPAERRLNAVFNGRTRAARALAGSDEEEIAEGVWIVRGGMPGRWINAYLVEDDDGGVLAFDAGSRTMAPALAAAAARHGGLTR